MYRGFFKILHIFQLYFLNFKTYKPTILKPIPAEALSKGSKIVCELIYIYIYIP